MRHVIDQGGFDAPLPRAERQQQRNALSLVTSLALALCVVVAVTAVSVGIAQAEILVATRPGDGSMAIFLVIFCIIVGAVMSEIYRRRQH